MGKASFIRRVDMSLCVDCGLCEKVCPVIHHGEDRKPLTVYAAKHKDDKIRLSSSSGGAFTALAENVINEDGVVFGAKFDEDWSVFHDYTDTKEGLAAFRGSKYVQSRIGDSFKKSGIFLESGPKGFVLRDTLPDSWFETFPAERV
ncbi:4Fe-4S binding protein [Parabacteroides distasonis]|nr:4Fe-4S binding protein [Parabacteroides distasonis]